MGWPLRSAVLAALLVLFASPGIDAQRRYGGGERDPQPPKATLAILGGMLIDGHEGPPVHHAVILVDGNTIVAVGTRDSLKVPPGTPTIDASGMTVMPGLIDAHVHLDTIGHTDYQYWHRTYRSRIQDIYQISATGMLQYGVTSALDLGASADDVAAFKKKAESGEVASPRIRMVGGFITNLSDDYIKTWHRGYQTANARTVDEARAAALKWIGYEVDALKAYTGLTGEQVRVISVDEWVEQVDYVISLVGEDHVAMGFDMSRGGGYFRDFDATKYPLITEALVKKGYSEQRIEKILGGNWLRLFAQAHGTRPE